VPERLFAECDKDLFTAIAVELEVGESSYERGQHVFSEQLAIFRKLDQIVFVSQDFGKFGLVHNGHIVDMMARVVSSFRKRRAKLPIEFTRPCVNVDLAVLKDGRIETVAKDQWLEYDNGYEGECD
jgi:hypothetical protein